MTTFHRTATALLIATLAQGAALAQPATAQPSPAAARTASATQAPAPAALSLGELNQRLLAAGYRDIVELKRERDHFEAEAVNAEGRRVELELALDTAAVRHVETKRASDRRPPAGLDMAQLLERVEAAGYRSVRKIEREHDGVEVKAEDAQGQQVTLQLDPANGAVRQTGRN